MRIIPLTKGKVAFVDDEDHGTLSQYKWHALKGRHTWYAARSLRIGQRRKRYIQMHREILKLTFGDRAQGDHRDGNGLNNQRYNLRISTSAQNHMNQRIGTHVKSSQFKGVTLCAGRRKPWVAQIMLGGRHRTIGYFHTEQAAALAYNEAAKVCFGEFARLNIA